MAQVIQGEVHTQNQSVRLKREVLLDMIDLYEAIIYGNGTKIGTLEVADPYYKNTWNDELKEIETMKQVIKPIFKEV